MTDRDETRSGDAGQPWASLLDPVANLRAFGDVQAQALRAASDVVERLVRLVDGPSPPEPAEDDHGAGEAASGEAGRLAERWAEALGTIARMFDRPDAPEGHVEIALGRDRPADVLRLTWDRSEPASAEVWLRNETADPWGPLRLSVGDLTAADGRRLDGHVTAEPAVIDMMPARSSRGVLLTLDAEDPPPGSYRALLQVEGAGDAWLALEVTVPPGSAPA